MKMNSNNDFIALFGLIVIGVAVVIGMMLFHGILLMEITKWLTP